MKHSKSITNLIKIGALLLATGWAHHLNAFTYTNSNILLVFREDPFNTFKDVEFNLGSVSNFLGKPDGTVITVTNWDLGLVKSNFNNTLANVKFLLLAVTEVNDLSKRVWLTDADQSGTPTDITGSKWSQLYSKISYIGAQAAAATATNGSEVYNPNPSDGSSYSYTASDNNAGDAATINGVSPFTVEGVIPATNRFIELKTSSATTKPAATIVGTFSLTSAGVLTFTAGSQVTLTPSHVASVTRSGGLNAITFTTISGVNYRLRYSASPLPPTISGWTILPTSVAGDGSNKTLTDTTSDPWRFYAVEAYH